MSDLDPIATTNKKFFDSLGIAVATTFRSDMYGTTKKRHLDYKNRILAD